MGEDLFLTPPPLAGEVSSASETEGAAVKRSNDTHRNLSRRFAGYKKSGGGGEFACRVLIIVLWLRLRRPAPRIDLRYSPNDKIASRLLHLL